MNSTAGRINTQMLAAWAVSLAENGYGANTVRTYASVGKRLLAWLEKDDEPNWVNRYFNDARGRLSASTLQVHRAAARALFVFLGEADPLETYRMPPVAVNEPHPLPGGMADVELLLSQATNRNQRLLIAFCGLAGLRVSEARRVTLNDLNPTKMVIRVFGKGEKYRNVPISNVLSQAIMFDVLEAHTVIPVWDVNKPLITLSDSAARETITGLARKCGIERPVASHDLRMTFATHVYEKTLDIRFVQQLLGHSSIETTQGYVGVNSKRSAELINKVFRDDQEES